VFRARRHCRDGALPRPNVITARALPARSDQVSLDVELTPAHVRTLDALTTTMARAPELGSALKVEAEFETQIRHGDFGRGVERNGQIVLGLTEEAFAEEEASLLAALQRLADQTTSSAAERLFAAEASDAIRFVEAMRRRYDVVLMNPPFGEPVAGTKPYLRSAYPWAPSGVDLFAVFVGRGLELCKADGYVGAITSRVGMFKSTFKNWRQEVLLSHRLTTLADLGYRVMAEAKVEAAAYVLAREAPEANHRAVFLRLLKGRDKGPALAEAIARQRAGVGDDRVYRLPLADLNQVPGAPIAYSMSPTIRRLFSDLPALSRHAEVKVGLQTGDDGRFVRAFWEVDPRRIIRLQTETGTGGRWAPFAKGGEYGQYWSDINLVVDWERDGERIRRYAGARPQNTQYYFRPGLTWSLRTNSAMSVRVLPGGCIFAHMGPGIVADHAQPLLAWLNSRYVRLLIDATSAGGEQDKADMSRSYEVGIVASLPDPTGPDSSVRDDLARLALTAARLGAQADELDETTRRFVAPAVLHGAEASILERARRAFRLGLARALEVIEAHDEADRVLRAVLDPADSAEEALYEADGPLVTDLPAGGADPGLLARTVSQVVAESTARRGIARWIGLQHHTADRRLELAAVAEERSPRALLDAAPPDLLPPEEPRRTIDDLISYLMGVALGRWDVRIGRDPGRAPARPDLFDPVPVCSPGMLVGDDGFPPSQAPPGYPLELPSPRLLIDQPGNPWDVEAAIDHAAAVLFADPTAVLQDVVGILGRDLRPHLRRQFFRDHLTRYTKSQRKAPIYWPLYVPSGAWGVWVYAPAFSREMLFAVVRTAAGRLDAAEAEIRRLRRERDAGGAGRSAREVVTLLEAEENLAEELRRFRDEAERVAGLGWEPDMDDGIVLCAAPLATLFRAWRDAATARDDLRAGRYPWATVSRWAEQL
jgi:Eco57I restriction-modification methylase